MATKRNNEIKEFAIGTKIEYNGKLYEVIERNNCYYCSLKDICPNNDITKNNNSDNILSRGKRLSIFGECSYTVRSDNKSVVFKEIPKDDSKDEYYKVLPLWIDDNSIQLRPVEFDLPKGYEIDKEHSDLDKGIIRFKNKWLSLEQLYRLAKENNHTTHRDAIKNFTNIELVALANLMDIARYFNGNWKYNVTKENIGYMIVYDKFVSEPHYSVRENCASVNSYYGNPVFKNEADAEYVIDNPNFRHVLDIIFKV